MLFVSYESKQNVFQFRLRNDQIWIYIELEIILTHNIEKFRINILTHNIEKFFHIFGILHLHVKTYSMVQKMNTCHRTELVI